MKNKWTLGLLPVAGILLTAAVVGITALSLVNNESNDETEDARRQSNQDASRDQRLPVGAVNEENMPQDSVAYPSALLIPGGKPTGGFLNGEVVQGNFASGGLWTYLVQSWEHQAAGQETLADFFGADLSVSIEQGAKTNMDFIPVYSSLRGNVVEVRDSDGVGEDKAEYGSFVRVRNAQYACVLTQDLWDIEADRLRSQAPQMQGQPQLYFREPSNSGCADIPASQLSDQCNVDRTARCENCGPGGNNCMVDWYCYRMEERCETDDDGQQTCRQVEKVVNSCLKACDDTIPNLGKDVICRHLFTFYRQPGYSANGYSMAGLTRDNFPQNTSLDFLKYFKIPNYEILFSHLTPGSIGSPEADYSDNNTRNCNQVGAAVDGDDQCATMGLSGVEDAAGDAFVHYEVWRYPAPGQLEKVIQPARAVNHLPDRVQCSTRPNASERMAEAPDNTTLIEDFIGCEDEPATPTIPSPCCPPVDVLPGESNETFSCESDEGGKGWEVRGGMSGDNYLVQILNSKDKKIEGEWEIELTCGEKRWACIVEGELNANEAWAWEGGKAPTVCFREDEAGDAPVCETGSEILFKVKSRLSDASCDLPAFNPREGSSYSDADLAGFRSSVDRHNRACNYDAREDDPVPGNLRQLAGQNYEVGSDLPTAPANNPFACPEGGVTSGSPLGKTVVGTGNETFDLLDYMLPSTAGSYQSKMTLGAGEEDSIAHERILLTSPAQLGDRQGFTLDWYTAEVAPEERTLERKETFSYDDELVYYHSNSNWQNQDTPREQLSCANDSPAGYALVDGIVNVDASNQCGSFPENQSSLGARWLPRNMRIGESFNSTMTLFGQESANGNCCSIDGAGPMSEQTVRLVEWIALESPYTGTIEDVIHLEVTAGARRGEHYYYAKGKGLVAYELSASRGGVCTRAYRVD